MASKSVELQRLMRQYKFEKGVGEVDMRAFAEYCIAMGWPVPQPQDPVDILARQCAVAAREEIRIDKETKRPYRANMAVPIKVGDKQGVLWIDTDAAPRHRMEAALNRYREQMIGEAVMGTNTAEHWNRTNLDQLPLVFDADLSEDVAWRQAGEDDAIDNVA